MKKKIITGICVAILIILLSILLFVREKKIAEVITKDDEEENTILTEAEMNRLLYNWRIIMIC